jgi:regulator of RNase E activity RraA
MTAQVETVTQMEGRNRTRSMELYEAIGALRKPAVVVFQEIGGFSEFAAHCGEVMATIFLRVGAVGLVSDCAVRDLPEVRALKFHYFARGAVASHAYFRIARVGVPVQICGMELNTGDLLHGDENGLLQIPAEALEKLPEAVAKIQTAEGGLMGFARGADFTLDGLRARISEYK